DYTGEIKVASNDPQLASLTVPVTLTVLPTADMGEVVGVVSDAWTGLPLTATVQLAGVYTMTARPGYAIWATAGSYTLRAYAPGYYTATHALDIVAGAVVTANLSLEPAQPRLEWSPSVVEATVTVGRSTVKMLAIANSGPLSLDVA